MNVVTYIASKCANTLKKKNKSFNASLSDEEVFDDSGDEEQSYAVLTGIISSVPSQEDEDSEDSDTEDFDYEKFMDDYKIMHSKCQTLLDINRVLNDQLVTLSSQKEELMALNTVLQDESNKMNETISDKDAEINNLNKIYKLAHIDKNTFAEIQSNGQSTHDKSGLGSKLMNWASKKKDDPIGEKGTATPPKDLPWHQKWVPKKKADYHEICEKPTH